MSLTGGKFDFDRLDLRVRTRNGAESRAALSGWVSDVFGAPRVGGLFVVEPTPLGDLLAGIPGVDDASGLVQARLRVDGPLASPAFTGEIELEGGELRAAALPTALSDMKLLVRVDGDELRIVTGRARVGGGQVVFGGAAKISEFDLRDVRLTLDATDVALTPTDGVRVVADASLSLDATSGERSGERALPTLVGDINIRDFVYTRPVRLAGALPTAGRTRVDGYDPARDRVRFDITLHADRPMKLANNLIDAELEMDPEGLVLGGTDQRYGLRGALRVRPGGRLRLRRSVFEVRDGRVRFEDMTRIAPKVDLTAVTQYRRSGDAGIESQGADVEGTTSLSAGGRWLVTLHASGDADDLRLSLTSEPALAQEDLFLLLTVGLTRAELEQARAATLGGSVALEAVSALSGADEAVTRVLPVIDDFRFGSAYSPSTGKTEPTVTIGKRLTETIRANVTSGLTGDSQEVRSNLEWRLSDSLSVEGSYDNVNDLAGSSLGNVGADVRWRLEFE
jgi:translocation and assembly module TamB